MFFTVTFSTIVLFLCSTRYINDLLKQARQGGHEDKKRNGSISKERNGVDSKRNEVVLFCSHRFAFFSFAFGSKFCIPVLSSNLMYLGSDAISRISIIRKVVIKISLSDLTVAKIRIRN